MGVNYGQFANNLSLINYPKLMPLKKLIARKLIAAKYQ